MENARPPQMIWMPAPEIEPSTPPAPLPNVLAVTRRVRPVREFTTPVEARPPAASPALPEAPRTSPLEAKTLPFAAPPPKPQPRPFVPPADSLPRTAAPLTVPEAPNITDAPKPTAWSFAAPLPKPQPRPFVPPADPLPRTAAPLTVPEAPNITDAPRAAAVPFAAPLGKPQPRAFSLPSEPLRPAPAPVIESPPPALASLAIVGLDPAKVIDFSAPPGPRPAGFSGGPQPRLEGSDTEGAANAPIVVPGLLAHGNAPDSRPVLAAALPPSTRERLAASVRIAPRPAGPSASEPRATRVAEAPDPLLEGRTVYLVAIQMPNVTSYIGSWLVWFAERDPALPGPVPEIQPPLPLHKVDPKYIAAAVAERIEGKVRLAAVIRKDGRVDSVKLLRHLDDRLDRSAEEALAKWEFEPAFRAGRAVDVDAVFEIPFTLAPKNAK